MYCIIFVTCPSDKTAKKKIANILLKEKLVACINIIPKVKSLYWWKGKIEKSDEILMLIKSKIKLFDEIKEKIKKNHPYEVPEIFYIKIEKGLEKYLEWINEVTK